MDQPQCGPLCGQGQGLRNQGIFDLDAYIPQAHRIISKTINLTMVQQLRSIPNRKIVAIMTWNLSQH